MKPVPPLVETASAQLAPPCAERYVLTLDAGREAGSAQKSVNHAIQEETA